MNSSQLPLEQDLATAALQGRRVALVGYGNQGRAHALNLRDSGIDVVVTGRPGSEARARATAEGLATSDAPQAIEGAALVVVALPDEVHEAAWRDALAPCVRPGQTVGFIHGSSVHFGLVRPAAGIGVVLVAPKGPGTTLRERFTMGQGIPALLAVAQEREAAAGEPTALELARAWATAIGCGRAGVVRTTFEAEAVTDLFGEQAVLCGGMLGLAQAAFDTLVAAGYPPALAYTECVHEIKQVADLLYARGPAGMRAAISNTAEFGTYSAAPVMVDDHVRDAMKALLDEIRSGRFTRRMQDDHDRGAPWFRARRAAAAALPIEAAGRDVRSLMPWLSEEPGAAGGKDAARP
jgi:ketol-acid reductoisomerase